MKITKKQARHLLLAHQKVWQPRKLHGKEGILEFIHNVGCIQFDPLDMVGYNPSLVLQSRIDNYQPDDLQQLLYSERRLLDGLDKNMSIYSIEDWPYFTRYREAAYQHYREKYKPINKILSDVRRELDQKGPLSSGDLKFDAKIDWAWAPTRAARAALESMYFWGELIIHHKVGTRKFYDFAKKHLPAKLLSLPDPNLSLEEYLEWHVKRRIGALGLMWARASDTWLGIRCMKGKARMEAISRLDKKGELLPIEIQDIKYTFYIRREESSLLEKVLHGSVQKPEFAFIAPLDNLLWDRKLIKELFQFDYIWEVYKPVSERTYGYYVLPVLYGDSFVARFEPKFDKKSKKLHIINWWWEEGISLTSEMVQPLIQSFEQFAKYLGATGIELNCNKSAEKKLKWLSDIIG